MATCSDEELELYDKWSRVYLELDKPTQAILDGEFCRLWNGLATRSSVDNRGTALLMAMQNTGHAPLYATSEGAVEYEEIMLAREIMDGQV